MIPLNLEIENDKEIELLGRINRLLQMKMHKSKYKA